MRCKRQTEMQGSDPGRSIGHGRIRIPEARYCTGPMDCQPCHGQQDATVPGIRTVRVCMWCYGSSGRTHYCLVGISGILGYYGPGHEAHQSLQAVNIHNSARLPMSVWLVMPTSAYSISLIWAQGKADIAIGRSHEEWVCPYTMGILDPVYTVFMFSFYRSREGPGNGRGGVACPKKRYKW